MSLGNENSWSPPGLTVLQPDGADVLKSTFALPSMTQKYSLTGTCLINLSDGAFRCLKMPDLKGLIALNS